jgi:hypothetical protein
MRMTARKHWLHIVGIWQTLRDLISLLIRKCYHLGALAVVVAEMALCVSWRVLVWLFIRRYESNKPVQLSRPTAARWPVR